MIEEILNEINSMSAIEIAEVIMFEDMSDEEADRLFDAIPVELVSKVQSLVE